MKEKIGICFRHGLMCDEYEKQANEQGFTLGSGKEKFAKIKSALATIRMNGLVNDGQYKSILGKLQKQLIENLEPTRGGGKQ